MGDLSKIDRAEAVLLVGSDASGGETYPAQVDLAGGVRVLQSAVPGGVAINDGVNPAVKATVNSSGRLLVSQEPASAPPSTTPVLQVSDGAVAGTSDSVYLIPAGTLTLQTFAAGAQASVSGAAIELWYDPNGNGVGMVLIDKGFASGSNVRGDESVSYTGNGVRSIRTRRMNLGGGSIQIFARWTGYYV